MVIFVYIDTRGVWIPLHVSLPFSKRKQIQGFRLPVSRASTQRVYCEKKEFALKGANSLLQQLTPLRREANLKMAYPIVLKF